MIALVVVSVISAIVMTYVAIVGAAFGTPKTIPGMFALVMPGVAIVAVVMLMFDKSFGQNDNESQKR